MPPRNKPVACCAPPHHNPLAEEVRTGMVCLAKAIADPTRLEVLRLLADQAAPVCACDIAALFELSQPTMSHHLKKLADAGLVRSERSGLWNYYEIDEGAMQRLERLTALVAPR